MPDKTPEQIADELLAKAGYGVGRHKAHEHHARRPLNGSGAGPDCGVTLDDKTPLTLVDWLKRDLPKPDLLLPWLSTTSRVLFAAPTGIGKTMFGIGLGMRAADGKGFLHWAGVRPARVLFVDGEMAQRLLQQRLIDEAARLGRRPEGFHILSHEDVENFRPLNTPEGQAFIERVIERIGGVDLIIFDNIMSLLAGNMKETEQWAATMPWVRSLTRGKIGQIWLHHTNDEGNGYGDKTREWQMDTVIIGEEVKRPDTDVSFQLTFRKARERTPETRRDFDECTIALVNDEWISSGKTLKRSKLSPSNQKFLDALTNVYASDATESFNGRKVVRVDHWRTECELLGLIEPGKTDKARSWFSRNKRELIERNYIASHFDHCVWKL
jgi:hypothetical protein